MGINEIYDLLKKYREHRCTPEEEERIARWYEQFDDEVENLPEVPEGKLEQLWFFIKRKIYVPWTWRVVLSLCRGYYYFSNAGKWSDLFSWIG